MGFWASQFFAASFWHPGFWAGSEVQPDQEQKGGGSGYAAWLRRKRQVKQLDEKRIYEQLLERVAPELRPPAPVQAKFEQAMVLPKAIQAVLPVQYDDEEEELLLMASVI